MKAFGRMIMNVDKKMKRNRWFKLAASGLALLLLVGCAGTGRKADKLTHLPPGLDSTTVVRATGEANQNFVSTARERKAERSVRDGQEALKRVDEFWAFLEKDVKEKRPLSTEEKTRFDREYAQGAQLLNRWKALSQDGSNEKVARDAIGYCQAAQQHLEEAIRINPFEKNARVLLAVTYYNLQHLFGMQKNHEKAVEILERLIRIEKGEHNLFRLLAENYAALKKYDLALVNFKKALSVLVQTSFEAAPDTSLLFYYAYSQGDAYARLYDAANALTAFQVAQNLARTPEEKSDVENYLKWINWDAGNIKASEAWDKILALESSKNYQAMAELCAKIMPYLKTARAKLSVHHRLAVVEFEFLGQKDQAVQRMLQIFDTLPVEALEGKDPDLKPVLESYGAMLYRLGLEARERDDKRTALAYFTKAVSFSWDQMARAYLELVALLWNNPEKAIIYGKRALEQRKGLTEKETCDLLSLLVKAHKSAGLYDQARDYFNQWKQCKSPS